MLTAPPTPSKVEPMMTTGRLYLVSLPIGNLADITLRAIKTLRAVDFIVAEDTRTTRKLLTRYRIETPFYRSYYQGVERTRVAPILELLKRGKKLALVSEAGTPLISDPGYPLVRAAVDAGLPVVPIPGPTAVIAALVASGLPIDRFAFEGAVPRRMSERRARFEALERETRTAVFYESPHRLLATLKVLGEILPERTVVLARELTKLHEAFFRGRAAALLESLHAHGAVKGECVLLIEGKVPAGPKEPPAEFGRLVALLEEEAIPKKTAVKILTRGLGLPRNVAYRLVHKD
jgi:16S rRNA (cytidine1402-2'-O)-methyltransferase